MWNYCESYEGGDRFCFESTAGAKFQPGLAIRKDTPLNAVTEVNQIIEQGGSLDQQNFTGTNLSLINRKLDKSCILLYIYWYIVGGMRVSPN